MGRADLEQVADMHVTQVFSFPSGTPGQMDRLTEEERGKLDFAKWFTENRGAYDKFQPTELQSLAHPLADQHRGLGRSALL